MSRMSELDWQLRIQIVEEIQQVIDGSPDSTHPDFIAGLETAIAVVTHDIDAFQEESDNA
jgi:hypothetical protein